LPKSGPDRPTGRGPGNLRGALHSRDRAAIQYHYDVGNEFYIVSVGMFEHVGRGHLPEYFAQVYRLLKPGGLFLNHGISRRAAGNSDHKSGWQRLVEHRLGSGSFVWRYTFPDGELTPVSEVNTFAEAAGFEVRDVENPRREPTFTLREPASCSGVLHLVR